MSEKTRAYIYRVILAAVPLMILFGWVPEDQSSEWVLFAGAVLGVGGAGLATANTTTKPD